MPNVCGQCKYYDTGFCHLEEIAIHYSERSCDWFEFYDEQENIETKIYRIIGIIQSVKKDILIVRFECFKITMMLHKSMCNFVWNHLQKGLTIQLKFSMHGGKAVLFGTRLVDEVPLPSKDVVCDALMQFSEVAVVKKHEDDMIEEFYEDFTISDGVKELKIPKDKENKLKKEFKKVVEQFHNKYE